jgi:Tfp pilus assembly protein PilO
MPISLENLKPAIKVFIIILAIFLVVHFGVKVSYTKVQEGLDSIRNLQEVEDKEEDTIENKKYNMLQASLDDITFKPIGGGRYQASDISKYQCPLPVFNDH